MANYLANMPVGMPDMQSDSDSSNRSECDEGADFALPYESRSCAESYWYTDTSSVEGSQVQLVFAAFRRRHFSTFFEFCPEPLSLSSSAAFKQELWAILSDTQDSSADIVRNLTHEQSRKSAICGKIWGKNDLAYRCLDCGTGPCSAICAECFINGDHKNHNYVMYQSSAGGCCDCGDADAWLPSGNCCFHSDSNCRLLQSLPLSVSTRMYTVVSSVLWVHCASISFGNYEFADDVIDWLLSVAESCDILRELVGDVFIQRLPPGDPETPEISYASCCIEALVLYIQSSLKIDVPIPVSFFALHRHDSHPVIPNMDTLASPATSQSQYGSQSLFMSFINTHLFCLDKSNKLLLTIVLLPAVKNAFGESFIRRYHTMIQIITQQPHGADGEFCLNLQDQMIDLSVQLLSNARIVQHLVTRCSYFSVLFSSFLEALNRAVVPKDHFSAFVLPSVVCVVNSLAILPEMDLSIGGSPKKPDIRTAEVISIIDRIAELQSGCHVDIPVSYHACRLNSSQRAFAIPLNIGAKFDAAEVPRTRSGIGGAAWARVLTPELSPYIQALKDRIAFLQRNFGGIAKFPLTGGFPIPGTLQVDHIITDTGPDKKRLHVITSDLSNIFYHNDAVAVFLEDANTFQMFLNIAKLLQFADGQLMFVHRHIESAPDDKWIRGLNCEREHFSNIMTQFTSALAPGNVSVPSSLDRGQPQAPSSLPLDRQISILYSCLRRSVIFLYQYLTAAIEQDATFSIPMWLKATNQLLEHFDCSQFVTCCIFHPVSFHLPIHRTLSYFLALLTVHEHTTTEHSSVRELWNPSFAAHALQHPLSLLTAVCQARLNIWVRNGNMMHYRSWFYMHNFVRDQFINSDGFLLQAACAIINPDALWTRILASFGFAFTDHIQVLQSSALWFFTDQSETAPALLEGFLMLMLSLLTGSWSAAFVVGFSDSEYDKCRLRTEICSVLSIKDKTYSELQNILPRAVSSHPSFDSVLESLTSFTPPSSRTLKEGSYRLLPSAFEQNFSAVRVYFSAYRLGDVEAAILNWSSQFNSPSIELGTMDPPRKVRFVCSIDDPITSSYFPLIFCNYFWQILRCLCFSLCSNFDQKHQTSYLHLPAALAQAAVDAAVRSGREYEVFHKMNESVATFAWNLTPLENRELMTGGCTPVLTSIYDSLHAIKIKADSGKNLDCLAHAYNYTLHSIQKLSASSSATNGAAVRSRESDPSISRKRSTAMAARQSALARIRVLQKKFSCSFDENASSSPLHRVLDSNVHTNDSAQSHICVEPDKSEFQETPCASPAKNDETGGIFASASDSLSQSSCCLQHESLKYPGDDFCADDLGCCCICTMDADDNDPLGLLVSITSDPLAGSSRTFLSSLIPSDPLLEAIDNSESALIRSCGHAVHVSCMQSWLLMHQGPSSQFSDGFPCPLCRTQRNGVLPFAPRSVDSLVNNVLSSFSNHLIQCESASSDSNDVVVQAFTAFSDAADDENNSVFEEARDSFLLTCANSVLANDMDFEPHDHSRELLSVKLLHGHVRFFRSCSSYAESQRANSLVLCLLRRLNSYHISRVLSSCGQVDGKGSKLDDYRSISFLNDSDYTCLRSILIAATICRESSQASLIETSLQGLRPSLDQSVQDSPSSINIDASLSHMELSPSFSAPFEEVFKMALLTSFNRRFTSLEGLPSSISMTGNHLLTCSSHSVATLVATFLPSNSHAKCLTAAMLLLHVVAGFCPHLFKPPSMSQPLGMIELAKRTIFAVMSAGSFAAIGQRLTSLTQALHDDQKLLVSNLITHTMQFVCDIFLMSMDDFAALVPNSSELLHSFLNIWAELLSHAIVEERLCSIARFNTHSGFSSPPGFICLPSTFQELVWEHRRSNCCICSESSMRRKELCVCLFCGAVMCCNLSSNTFGADMLNLNRCFLMHTINCCGPPALGVAVCIGDTNTYIFRSSQQFAVAWGSLYLDKHGRADPNLRRIQGLSLSNQRLDLLRSQLLLRSISDNSSQP